MYLQKGSGEQSLENFQIKYAVCENNLVVSYDDIPELEGLIALSYSLFLTVYYNDNLILSTNMYVAYDDFGYDATIQISSDGEVFLSAKESPKR